MNSKPWYADRAFVSALTALIGAIVAVFPATKHLLAWATADHLQVLLETGGTVVVMIGAGVNIHGRVTHPLLPRLTLMKQSFTSAGLDVSALEAAGIGLRPLDASAVSKALKSRSSQLAVAAKAFAVSKKTAAAPTEVKPQPFFQPPPGVQTMSLDLIADAKNFVVQVAIAKVIEAAGDATAVINRAKQIKEWASMVDQAALGKETIAELQAATAEDLKASKTSVSNQIVIAGLVKIVGDVLPANGTLFGAVAAAGIDQFCRSVLAVTARFGA